MGDTVIRVEGLSKRYRIGEQQQYKTLRDTLAAGWSAPARWMRSSRNGVSMSEDETDHDHIWALKDVSFEVRRGEVLGVVGANGSGKSTLLKILCRIVRPTAGMSEVHGRLGALLEVGTGFHAELTGRENIQLNGAILGMKRAEIKAKFDEIVDFSGVETFLDTPVKHYSSGMVVRLAFAVASQLDSDILIVDEVLSVGDADFQRRSMAKIQNATLDGRTVIMVSHDLKTMKGLCSRAILLQHGRLHTDGTIDEVAEDYAALSFRDAATPDQPA